MPLYRKRTGVSGTIIKAASVKTGLYDGTGIWCSTEQAWIEDVSAFQLGKRRELMRLPPRGAHDVFDRNAARGERIGHQRPVAAPRHGFRAHDGDLFLLRQFH